MLKTVYFDAHHRHKWQCFRIRLVDKTNSKKALRLTKSLKRDNVNNNLSLKGEASKIRP